MFNHKSVDLKPSFANLLKCLSVYDVIFLVRFSLSFLFWRKKYYSFFVVMIFFKLFSPISFAYTKVKPSKLRNFFTFFLFVCYQLARFGIFSLYLYDMQFPMNRVLKFFSSIVRASTFFIYRDSVTRFFASRTPVANNGNSIGLVTP